MPDTRVTALTLPIPRLTHLQHWVLLALAPLSPFSCTHTQQAQQSNRSVKSETVTKDTQQSLLLSQKLITILPESQASANAFAQTDLGERLSRMTGRALTPQDAQTLIALRALLVAQRELGEQRSAQAHELAKYVLNTPNLSTHFYILALRYLVLSDVVSLTANETNPGSSIPARDPRSEFNAFQGLQCTSACQSIGWHVIAQEDPALLTANGYRTRILTEAIFKSENLQQPNWFKKLLATTIATKKSDKEDATAVTKMDTPLQRVLNLRNLLQSKQWNLLSLAAKKILNERSLSALTQAAHSCPAEHIFAQYALAQVHRIAQDRRTFAQLQENLVKELDGRKCTPDNFGFDKDQFDSFKLDARLWLARLQWEQNKNPEAFASARRVLDESANLQSWEHFADAAKVLLGRIGFEMLNPTENLSLVSAMESMSANADSDEFYVWLQSRRGLLHFLEGDFDKAKSTFERIVEFTPETSTRSMAFYWIGRSQLAAKRATDGENAFLSAGTTDPLSIYDIFSGQLLARESGRASTQAKQAFYADWKDELNSWLLLDEKKPLKIITSVPPRAQLTTQDTSELRRQINSQTQFDASLETAILALTLLRAVHKDFNSDEFSSYLRESADLVTHFVKLETQQLRQSFQRLNTLHNEVLPRAHQVAWLTHVLGDHANSILFAGRLREMLGWDTDYLPFLYFIFYPRPFHAEFQSASEKCSIDVDLLYALSRQESLFQASVKSPVGAVGLMQLMPSTANRILRKRTEYSQDQKIDLTDPSTNALAGACYLKQLLERYDNNLTFAIAAYNAGEAAVDAWVARRQKLPDMPFFIEFIPYAETKTYVQRVLRNYYNIKWIYRTQPAD